jgi:hypothetical protein
MKNLLNLIAFILLGLATATAQTDNTIDYVNHFGTVFPVSNKNSLSNPEFKRVIAGNKFAMQSLRKARWIRTAEITVDILAIVPLVVGISAENDAVFLGGVGLYAATIGLSYVMFREPYNRHIKNAIEFYNKGLPAGQ